MLNVISYVWRFCATLSLFFSFVIGALFFVITAIPIIKLSFSKQTQKRVTQFLIFVTFKILILTIQLLRIARFKFVGFEKLKDDNGCLFIANHPSLIDYIVITSKLKNCNNIVKASIINNRLLKHIVLTAGYIPNLSSDETLEKIQACKQMNENILMFPEGTRTPINNKISMKRGAAQIAIRFNMKIRLFHIHSHPRTLTKGENWYIIPPKSVRFRVEVGELINPSAFIKKELYPSLAARKLTAYITEKLTNGAIL